MFRAVLIACLVVGATRANANDTPAAPAPVRVAIECEEIGRTKTCPAFLLGLVDEQPVLLGSPRAGADIVIYATATSVGLVDRMHLRFVGQGSGMPGPVELDVEVDTRANDDEQRAVIAPVFRRGVA